MGWLKLTKRNRLSEVLGQARIDSKGEEPIYFAPCVDNHRAQERQRVEKALRESEEQYRRLVQDSSDAILIARGNKIVFVNHTGATLLGAGTAEQLIHRCPLDFFPPDHDRIAFSTIRHAIEQHDSLPSPRISNHAS